MSMNLLHRASWPARARPLLVAACLLAAPWPCTAEDGEHRLGSLSNVIKAPLQELVGRQRPKGYIYIAIGQAGLFGDKGGYRPFCSPLINLANSSNETVEELIFGIRYRSAQRKLLGTTATRFSGVRAGREEEAFFNSSVNTDTCNGVTGEVEIVRCVYQNGLDCSKDVRALEYGAVPLQLVPPPKEKR